MPAGAYLLSGHEGAYAVERFTCAEGPDGWRYVGSREHPDSALALGTIDLLADAAGRILRLEVTGGGWLLRGGVVGPEALWRRGNEERSATAHGFTGTSPSYAVVASRLAATREPLRLIAIHDAALATATVDQAWAASGGGWESTDLATGERSRWLFADGIVVSGPDLTLTTT